MDGFLIIDKPPRFTSRDVVNIVQRLVRPIRVGHAGTLDPLATGVLVVALGSATRLVQYVQQASKSYRAVFLLGRRSPTEDVDSAVEELADAPVPTSESLVEAGRHFIGPIMQRPPAYSAVHVAGRRAYDLARKGKTVDLAPRPVHVYDLRVLEYRYPRLEAEITCGSGTYIRSLGRDWAESLGTSAVMQSLVRTAVGSFQLGDALALDSLTAESLATHLLPMRRGAETVRRIDLDSSRSRAIALGQFIDDPVNLGPQDELAAFDPTGELIAIVRKRPDGRLGSVCTLRPASGH